VLCCTAFSSRCLVARHSHVPQTVLLGIPVPVEGMLAHRLPCGFLVALILSVPKIQAYAAHLYQLKACSPIGSPAVPSTLNVAREAAPGPLNHLSPACVVRVGISCGTITCSSCNRVFQPPVLPRAMKGRSVLCGPALCMFLGMAMQWVPLRSMYMLPTVTLPAQPFQHYCQRMHTTCVDNCLQLSDTVYSKWCLFTQ
jgi:hypothetical protein